MNSFQNETQLADSHLSCVSYRSERHTSSAYFCHLSFFYYYDLGVQAAGLVSFETEMFVDVAVPICCK